jgi:prepilin-type N-terminal cleavage/methylation domain-containing protein
MTQRKGFTLVEIMIVVAIIALLAAIAIPSFIKSRQESRKSGCINNLRLIDHAKQQYATANDVADSTVLTEANLRDYFKGGFPTCRVSTVAYTIGNLSNNPTCNQTGHSL